MRFPMFISDFILLLLAALSVALAFILPGILNFAIAIVAAGLALAMLRHSDRAIRAFEMSAGGIKGLEWRPVLLSFGTLEMDYCGARIRYDSFVQMEMEGVIPIDYALSMESSSKEEFEMHGTKEPGHFEESGSEKAIARVRKIALGFDRKYGLSMVKGSGGRLEFLVRLGFSKEPAPPLDKASDMKDFMRDYLEFACAVKKAIGA